LLDIADCSPAADRGRRHAGPPSALQPQGAVACRWLVVQRDAVPSRLGGEQSALSSKTLREHRV